MKPILKQARCQLKRKKRHLIDYFTTPLIFLDHCTNDQPWISLSNLFSLDINIMSQVGTSGLWKTPTTSSWISLKLMESRCRNLMGPVVSGFQGLPFKTLWKFFSHYSCNLLSWGWCPLYQFSEQTNNPGENMIGLTLSEAKTQFSTGHTNRPYCFLT